MASLNLGASSLFTARTTGLLDFRSMVATSSSAAVMPSRPSTKKTITSAVSMASSACRRIWTAMMSSLAGSMPPVSMRVKLWVSHSASA